MISGRSTAKALPICQRIFFSALILLLSAAAMAGDCMYGQQRISTQPVSALKAGEQKATPQESAPRVTAQQAGTQESANQKPVALGPVTQSAAQQKEVQKPATQKFTISGHIIDAKSGEPLIGAAILVKSSSTGAGIQARADSKKPASAGTGTLTNTAGKKASPSGTVTNNFGFYSLSIPGGTVQLTYSFIGYQDATVSIDTQKDSVINISLEPSDIFINSAVVTASQNETGVRGTQMSAVEVPVNQIRNIPAFAGETDVLKAIQLLPGVQSGTEASAGLYVRGGGPDENLLMIDGIPLYNVSHMFGFFSVFNTDAIKNVTLYKGNFPARFGGHLSSVVDVRMNDGNDQGYHGSVSIGLISAKVNVEGPIVKGKTSFSVSARRTYMDLLLQPVLWIVNKKDEKYGGGYDFYDVNAKVTHKFSDMDKLTLSFYMGDDNAHFKMKTNDEHNYNGIDGSGSQTESYQEHSQEFLKGRWRWGNMVTALRWNHVVNPKLYMNTTVSYTRYRQRLGVGYEEKYKKTYTTGEEESSESNMDVDYHSNIGDVSGNVDFEYTPNTRHSVKFGGQYTWHAFNPGVNSMSASDSSEEMDFSYNYGDRKVNAHEAAIYAEDNWTATKWLKINYGLRASLYSIDGKNWLSAEPRLSARALLYKDLSFKASYSEMSQYVHMLSNSSLTLPSDLWVPVTKDIRPMRSRQVAAGFFYSLGVFDFSVEGYWKTMDNIIEYKDGASFLGSTTGWEEKVCMGKGWSYGLELFVQKKFGKTTGWIGYTLSKAMRQFNKEGNMLNKGLPFPAKYDRRHDLNITVTHAFSKKFDLSATFVFSSGNCGTLAMQKFSGSHLDPGSNSFDREIDYNEHRNNYRMPPYHRLDIGMNFYRFHKRGTGIWNISIYNAYCHMNPFMVYAGYESEDINGEYVSRGAVKQISIFPIIPTFSYTYKF
ncbi:MAG: TonB-dependent receptor [Bacteroidales bacterium]|nr:TonB-dependent receptor [Bacteroidales bacterium]